MINLMMDSPWAYLGLAAIAALVLIKTLVRHHQERIWNDQDRRDRLNRLTPEKNRRRRVAADPWEGAK